MPDLTLFRVPTFVGASLAAFSVSAAGFAMLVFTPQFFLDVEGASPLGAGVRMLPFGLAALAASVLTGRLSDFLPILASLGIGVALVGGGLLLMHGVEASSGTPRGRRSSGGG